MCGFKVASYRNQVHVVERNSRNRTSFSAWLHYNWRRSAQWSTQPWRLLWSDNNRNWNKVL